MRPEVRIFQDCAGACEEAAIMLAGLLKGPAVKQPVSVALSGGSTPLGLFRLLASPPYRGMSGWELVHFFWADERCVAPEHPDSNYGAAYSLMLSKLAVPPSNIHRIKGELGPDEAADGYESDLRKHFGADETPVFDLIFLGTGGDGHTASLFPGSPQLSVDDRLAVPARPDGVEHPRVTLTLQVINNARGVVFLVCGEPKASVVKACIGGRKDLPAALVRPDGDGPVWLLDKGAASILVRGR